MQRACSASVGLVDSRRAENDGGRRRKTFKRNQHGTNNAVRLGRMFLAMMHARGKSQRELARAIAVSEGTIRNHLAYAQAADLRNRYASRRGADEDTEMFIGTLTIK